MSNAINSYLALLSEFLNGQMGVLDFQSAYLSKFKMETARFDDPTFDLLDRLFGDVDAYTSDQELLAENPSYYLDEDGLRIRVTQALNDLQPKPPSDRPRMTPRHR
jgi:hypothetical protein